MSELISNIEKLRYCRDEVINEFNLLAARSTMLVTCQSFLVVPFAILQTAADYSKVYPFSFLIGVLGIFVAIILIRPLDAAHQTINKWLVKKRKLISQAVELDDLTIDRDKIPGAEIDPDRDKLHMRSLAFSRFGPVAFIVFWCLAICWSAVRIFFLG